MNVLVLCTGNSCRSQMAEGFLRNYSKGEFNVFSAGIEKHGLNQKAVEVMQEIGIDISNHKSKIIDEIANHEFDYVLTVCDNAKENCPYFPAFTKLYHKDFIDPSKMEGSQKEIDEAYRSTRDQIGLFCKELVNKFNS